MNPKIVTVGVYGFTEDELRVKFDALAGPVMSESRRNDLHKAVFTLDTLDNLNELMALTVADK